MAFAFAEAMDRLGVDLQTPNLRAPNLKGSDTSDNKSMRLLSNCQQSAATMLQSHCSLHRHVQCWWKPVPPLRGHFGNPYPYQQYLQSSLGLL